jgi:hypothetical protein
MYVLTKEYNDYDQHGKYLVAVFDKEPTIENIKNLLECNNEYARHVLEGGGRINYEYDWYYLNKIKSGVLYQ